MENNTENTQTPETDVTNAANLDALAAPEGSYEPSAHGESFLGGSEESLLDSSNDENLAPNIDDEIKKENEPIQNTPETSLNEAPISEVQNEIVENTDTTTEENLTEYWADPFNKLKEQYSDFEIPDDLSKENYLDYLRQVHHHEAYNRIHPDLLRMQEALDAGIDFNQVVQSVQESTGTLQLNDVELLKQEYKSVHEDWDDKKIETVIEKLDNAGMLEIEAGRLRNRLKKDHASNLDNLKQEELRRSKELEATQVKEREEQIKDALQSLNGMDNVYGLPISKAEKLEFAEYFKNAVTPNESGIAPLMEMLQSNDNLVKIAAMIWKGSDKVKSAINEAKESGKNSIKDKLHSSPNTGYKSGGTGGEPTIDFDALAAPERLI